MTTRLTMRYGADGGGIGRGTSVNGPKGGGREVDGAADGMRWIGCQRGVAGGSWKTKSTGGRDDMDGRTGACSAWNGLTGSITVAGDSPGLRAGQQLLKRWVRWTRCSFGLRRALAEASMDVSVTSH